MFVEEIGNTVSIQLLNIASSHELEPVEYLDIISPFSRIYMITQGSGQIFINNTEIELEPGYLYLIPSYTFCTYRFNKDLKQYYIHFSNTMQNGLNIFDLVSCHNKVSAQAMDEIMIKRLQELHPDRKLPCADPGIYQSKDWMIKKVGYESLAQFMETKGIIEQLLSRFLNVEENYYQDKMVSQSKLKPLLIFIQNNLPNELSVDMLAEKACLSKDHFSRIFKSVTGLPPGEYILRKRIEKAQNLLQLTDMPQSKIIEKTGFKSLSYFSRIFTKYTKMTPGKYRQQR